MMKRLLALGAVLVVLGATARADDYFYATYSLVNGKANNNVAGEFTVNDITSGASYTAFCVDLKDTVSSGVHFYGNLSYGKVSDSIPSFNALASYNPGQKVSYLVSLWQGSSLNNDQILGLQAALWYVISGGNNFTPTTTGGAAIYNDLLTLLGGHALTGTDAYWSVLNSSTAFFTTGATYSSEIVLITPDGIPGSTAQYQTLVAYVPEPSSMAIAGLGALGFLAYGVRRRKQV